MKLVRWVQWSHSTWGGGEVQVLPVRAQNEGVDPRHHARLLHQEVQHIHSLTNLALMGGGGHDRHLSLLEIRLHGFTTLTRS